MVLIVGGRNQGKAEYAKTFGKEIIADYHIIIRTLMQKNENPTEYTRQLLTEKTDCVITIDEVGSGLIPVDAFERNYSEEVGRISCDLAAHAQAVYRMVCGIPQKIK